MALCMGLLLITLATPVEVCADWRQFIPKIASYDADLELYGSFESDKHISPDVNIVTKDTYFKEKLTLYTFGYSYHPNFIQYSLALSTSLKQEDFEQTGMAASGWTNQSGFEYDAEMWVLPKHPYNLTLFARRYEPVYPTFSNINLHEIQYYRGAMFNYSERPYIFVAEYSQSSSETPSGTVDVNNFHASGSYQKEFKGGKVFALSAGYDQTNFSSSTSDNRGNSHSLNASNTLGLSWVSLVSSVTQNNSSQETSSPGSVKDSFFTWNEVLNASLPLNFTVNAIYLDQKNTIDTEATATTPGSTLTNTQKQIGVTVQHNLFRSLTSYYSFVRNSFDSTTGEIVNTTNTIQTVYNKMIPWGTLNMGIGFSRAETESMGQTAIANEPHTSDVPGSFVLNLQEPNPATILVFLKSPVAPFELVLLTENINYVVSPIGNTFQINILTVPPPFVVPGNYQFLVSYSLTSEKFGLRTDFFHYNAGLSLFGDMVNPYYVFSKQDSTVVSGSFGGVPVDSTSNTFGIIVRKRPYSATAEYQIVDANINPYRRWLGELTWNSDLSPTYNLYVSGRYTNTNYPEGITAVAGPAYTDQTASFIANFVWRPLVHLYLSANGALTHRVTTEGDDNSYTLGSSFYWKVGRLILSLNASVTNSSSNVTTPTPIRTKDLHQLYFIKLVRKIF